MDGFELLAAGVGSVLVPLGLTARYLYNRLNALEKASVEAEKAADQQRESDNAALRAEVQVLRQRVAESERRETITRAEMDTTRTELNELHAALKTAMTEIAALRDQVTVLEGALRVERDEKAKAEARVKALAEQVTQLEATAARLTIERDTLAGLIRSKLDAHDSGEPRVNAAETVGASERTDATGESQGG